MSVSLPGAMNEAKEKHSETKDSRIRKHSPDPESSNVEKKLKLSSSDSTVDNEQKNESSNVEGQADNTVLVAKHYNSLRPGEIAERNQSRILYMRNFNNWIKSMLIIEYINKIKDKAHGCPLKVLDMCCGKGGDLLKWRKMNISHLICVDLAELTVKQCQERYNTMLKKSSRSLFTVEFLTADCTKVSIRKQYKDPSILLDMVSCQFALHYGFESLPQAECMMKNASDCLKPGGYFIGTIPDAYSLVSRWQDCDGNSFGNEIFNVEFFCDKTKPPLFGAKYHFQLEGVVNCPEFLVYLPVFRKLALKFGLELILFERFESFYERMKDNGKRMLNRIQALETYPPHPSEPLIGVAERDYQHAKDYIHNSSVRGKIGTLSQPEWEVTSLYAVFVFRKMKNSYNIEGKPEYVKL